MVGARRAVAGGLASAVGLVMLADYFVDEPRLDLAGSVLLDWAMLLAAAALVLGAANLLWVHLRRFFDGGLADYPSLALVVAFLLTVMLGLAPVAPAEFAAAFDWLLRYVYTPLAGAALSLVAFFLLPAAWGALRRRPRETAVLLGVAGLTLLVQLPLAAAVWPGAPALSDWLRGVPTVAALRGFFIGVGLGAALAGLRVLLGLEDLPWR